MITCIIIISLSFCSIYTAAMQGVTGPSGPWKQRYHLSVTMSRWAEYGAWEGRRNYSLVYSSLSSYLQWMVELDYTAFLTRGNISVMCQTFSWLWLIAVSYLISWWRQPAALGWEPAVLSGSHQVAHCLLPQSRILWPTVTEASTRVPIRSVQFLRKKKNKKQWMKSHLIECIRWTELRWTHLTQHMASCSCSSARRRPMHILFPMPKGTWAKALMVLFSRSQRSGLNCFPLSKYSSLEPSAWVFIIKTVCKWRKITITICGKWKIRHRGTILTICLQEVK